MGSKNSQYRVIAFNKKAGRREENFDLEGQEEIDSPKRPSNQGVKKISIFPNWIET